MNVLIVEDESIIAKALETILSRINCVNVIQIASTFDEAYQKGMSQVFDVILVDIFLDKDDLNGIDLCKSIRKVNPEVVLIIVTATHAFKFLEQAFAVGVNDYITKPFNYKELEIRIKRWLLLSYKITTSPIINYQELSYNTLQNEFYFQENHFKLTKKEKILLLLFLKKAEQILCQEYLQEKLWGDLDLSDKKRNIRSSVQLLRQALPPACQNWIQNIRGEGYVLKKS